MLKIRVRDLAVGVSALAFAMVAAPHAIFAADATPVADIVRAATDLPGPLAKRGPQRVRIDLETVELEGLLADGTTYRYWTFNGKVPGPFARVRVGDTVEVVLKNHEDSSLMHNVDFHAATGLHGGGHATKAMPGETRGFTFKALKPGLYVYHCATPSVAQHIASGMYGMILVEPEDGMPKVDREFYVMQGEIYTEEAFGTPGEATLSPEKTLHERPEYVVFNGAVGGLTEDGKPLKARVGETIRLFFGVGGPNLTSSFHVIGEIFDKVYPMGSATTKAVNDVQTVTVAPGGAVIVDITLEVPGTYVLVDHALSRVEKGGAGHLIVEGPADPKLFKESVDRKLSLN